MENQHTHEFQKSIDGTDKKTRFQKSPRKLQSESQTAEPYPFFGHGFTPERADYSHSAPLRQRAAVSVFCVSATDNLFDINGRPRNTWPRPHDPGAGAFQFTTQELCVPVLRNTGTRLCWPPPQNDTDRHKHKAPLSESKLHFPAQRCSPKDHQLSSDRRLKSFCPTGRPCFPSKPPCTMA